MARKVNPAEWWSGLRGAAGVEGGIINNHRWDGAVLGQRSVAQGIENGGLANGGSIAFTRDSKDEDCITVIATREEGC